MDADIEVTGSPDRAHAQPPAGQGEKDAPDAPAQGGPWHTTRRGATDAKIAEGVFRTLRTRGLQGVSIEAVAAESGVAKTTIYRRYSDRYDMLSGVSRQLTVSLGGNYPFTADGLGRLLVDVFDVFDRHGGGQVLSAVLLDEREEAAGLRASLIDPVVERIRMFLADSVAAGALREGVDLDLLVDLVLGGVMIATSRGDLGVNWAEAAVGVIWPLLAVTVADDASGGGTPA